MLTLNEYQKQTGKTDLSPRTDWYYALGLNGEAGEVAELVKKAHRKASQGVEVDYDKLQKEMLGELGDVLWYLAREAAHYNLTLEEVAQFNLEKLRDRQERGKIVG